MTEKAFLIFGFAPKFLKPMNMVRIENFGVFSKL